MKFEQTVENLPTGVMTCVIEQEEVGIVDFSPSHLKIRVPERLPDGRKVTKLSYYNLEEQKYEQFILADISWQEPEKKDFWWEYCGIIKDENYQKAVSFILKQYYEYVVLKSEAYDNSFSEKLVGYPAEKDEDYDEDYFSWKCRQFQEMSDRNFIDKLETMDVEIAVSLENPKCYETFLKEGFDTKVTDTKNIGTESVGDFMKVFYRGLYEKADRLYIGNQFCHNLFPEKEILFRLMKKASGEQKAITLVFTYLRDELLEETENLLEEVYQWSRENRIPLEIVVNDWGMLSMVRGKEDYFTICYGTLLNRRRKDPRYQYKNASEKSWENMRENSLNIKEYSYFLMNQGVSRLEYESSGYLMKLPSFPKEGQNSKIENQMQKEKNAEAVQFQGISMHLPLYQTNTSQYCTLHAICTKQDRGKQEFIRNCPNYCSSYVCMYPKHLQMIGKYNSLFAMDRHLLEHPEVLENYKKAGMDRIVWNLM